MNKKMDRNKFYLSTYVLAPYAFTEEHVKDLKECGIDYVISMKYDKQVLDLFEKYGLGSIVAGVFPHWWGGKGENAGKMHIQNPIECYEAAAENFKDHPAIWAIDCGDEPSALDFPHYGKVMDKVNKLFPNNFAYVNLYPNYASVAKNNSAEAINQLGAATYEEHIQAYCENVATDYICYDFYVYSYQINKMYENLRVVSDACQKTGRSMWIVLQVNSSDKDVILTENMLRYQAYTALAFGVETISWACWCKGWWHNNVLDENGNKTVMYERLKNVNLEIKSFADKYMEYKRVSTHFIGFDEFDPELENVKVEKKKYLSTGVFNKLRSENKIVVGQMVSKKADSKYALFIAAADDPFDTLHNEYYVTFEVNDRKVSVLNSKYPLEKTGDNAYRIKICSNEGVLIEAE